MERLLCRDLAGLEMLDLLDTWLMDLLSLAATPSLGDLAITGCTGTTRDWQDTRVGSLASQNNGALNLLSNNYGHARQHN